MKIFFCRKTATGKSEKFLETHKSKGIVLGNEWSDKLHRENGFPLTVKDETSTDLIMIFDSHAEGVDKNGNQYSSLEHVAAHPPFHMSSEQSPNV